MMEEGDISHHCLLIWFFNTYVCEWGKSAGTRADIKGRGIGVGRERKEEAKKVWTARRVMGWKRRGRRKV